MDITIIKPLNGMGAELSVYEQDAGLYPVAMDSGIIVFENYTKTSHIFLCDNTPYDPSSSDYISGLVGDEHSLVSIFYPFNGAAQDYPLCYDSLSFADKKYLVEDRNKHRNLVIDRLSVALNPAVLCIPYSSFHSQWS